MQLNADIAVLSACNSGMGKLSHSEGVIGVASGFAYAGVPNIIMSKWPVSDWSTSILMLYFYQNIKKGIPKAEALQQAKKTYLNKYQKNSEQLAPMYWGAFVLHGNNEVVEALLPLPFSNYGIILVLFVGFVGFIFWRLKSKNS